MSHIAGELQRLQGCRKRFVSWCGWNVEGVDPLRTVLQASADGGLANERSVRIDDLDGLGQTQLSVATDRERDVMECLVHEVVDEGDRLAVVSPDRNQIDRVANAVAIDTNVGVGAVAVDIHSRARRRQRRDRHCDAYAQSTRHSSDAPTQERLRNQLAEPCRPMMRRLSASTPLVRGHSRTTASPPTKAASAKPGVLITADAETGSADSSLTR